MNQTFTMPYGACSLENLVVNADGTIDFNDDSKTENTRVSYPIYHINNIVNRYRRLVMQGK